METNEKIKQVFHVESSKSFGTAEGNENERRFDDAKIDRLNLKETNNYDKTRRKLDFEIGPDRKVHPLGYRDKPLSKLLHERLAELGFKPWKKDAPNAPNIAARIIFGGNHDRMNELAFGKQQVNLEKGADNSDITRHKDIENWAKDVYNWCCERFGKENVIGLQVHLDETTAHAHALVVPVGKTPKRGKTKVMWAAHFGEHKTGYDKIMEEFHTDLYNKVGKKWGLERGDSVKGRNVKHLTKEELDAFNKEKAILDKAIKGLQTMKSNLENDIAAKQKSISDLDGQLANKEITLEQYEAQKQALTNEIADSQAKLDDKNEKLTQKQKEFNRISKAINTAKSAYTIKHIDESELIVPSISSNPPLFGVDSWKAKENAQIAKVNQANINKVKKHYISQANALVNQVRKDFVADTERLGELEQECVRLSNDNDELALDLANALAIMANDTARKLVLQVATLLFNEQPVPSVGGGGGDTSLPWDGRKRDEDEEDYRRRCLLAACRHMAKIIASKSRIKLA